MKRMIGPEEARDRVLAAAEMIAPLRVAVSEALGAVLAEDIAADRDCPPFNRAMMDGYAVRLADAGRDAVIVGEAAAGTHYAGTLRGGEAVAIMTGAPCPKGTDMVVPVEAVTVTEDRVRLPEVLSPGKHIAPAGSECGANTIVAREGARLTPLHIANLAAFGYPSVAVRQPRALLITTGEELAAPGAETGPWQIRNSNGPMLEALLAGADVTLAASRCASDCHEDLRAALELSEPVDLVILSGGVSAGKYDLVPAALEEHGVTLLFHKVTQKPGKPLLFGKKEACLFFGLPGNPLACHACFHHYIAPALRKMTGRPAPPRLQGVLDAPISAPGARTNFALCHARYEDAAWRLTPVKGKGSADIHAVCGANAYVCVDAGATLEAGAEIPFLFLGDFDGP